MEFVANKKLIQSALRGHHLTQRRVADLLGISPGYLSTVLNGHAGLSTELRRRMLDCEAFRGIPEDQLWSIRGAEEGISAPTGGEAA